MTVIDGTRYSTMERRTGSIRLRDYQIECVDTLMRGLHAPRSEDVAGKHPHLAAVLPTGSGKGHPLDTEVPTPDGLRLWGDLRPGDHVFGSDGRPTKVIAVYDRGELPVYRVTMKHGESVIVDGEHLWQVQRKNRKTQVAETQWLARQDVRNYDGWIWSVPVADAVVRPERDLPLHPYVVGALIANGGMAHAGTILTTPDDDVIERVRQHVTANRMIVDEDLYCPRFSLPGLTAVTRALGLRVRSGEKRIPRAYLEASVAHRVALLHGLMDCDGSVRAGGWRSVNYHTTSQGLSEDVAELVTSLGGTCSVHKADRTDDGKAVEYTCGILLPSWIEPMSTTRKIAASVPRRTFEPRSAIVSIEPAGTAPIRCIRVAAEDSLYLITRNHIVTHNTVIFSALGDAWHGRHPGEPILILAHRDELITQAAAKYRNVVPDARIGVIKAERHEVAGREVVVASVQSLNARRRERLGTWRPSLVIIDEAHHSTSRTYRDIIAWASCPVVGVTATMSRSDGKALGRAAGGVFDEIVYQKSILWMIRQGYLCDVKGQRVVVDDLDLTGMRKVGGDYSDGQVSERLLGSSAPEAVAKAVAEYSGGQPGVIFAPTVESAQAFAEAMCAAGFSCETVWGAMPLDRDQISPLGVVEQKSRRRVIREFNLGKIDWLSSCMALCLDTETEILTDQGWTRHDEMTTDHRVANWDQGRVFFEKPLEIVRRPLGEYERMYRLLTKGRDIRVTGGHRMLYRTSQVQEWRKAPVEELVGRTVLIPTVGWAEPFDVAPSPIAGPKKSRAAAIRGTAYNLRRREGFTSDAARVEAERRVDRRRALRHLDPSELTEDQCRFIGFWLGDGSRNDLARGGVEYTASQSVIHPKIIEWFDRVIAECGFSVVRYDRSSYDAPHVRWSFPRGTGGGSQERAGLFGIEPYLIKDGTELLWGLNARQFDALLEGLWYADGNHARAEGGYPARWQLWATRKGLLDLLQAIGTVRGMNLTVRSVTPPRSEGHTQLWVLTRSASVDHCTVRHRFEPDPTPRRPEEVWCVKTITRNIITRRNGTVTVMGNTEGWDAPRATVAVIARATQSASLFIQMAGRVLRPFPGKSHALILDVVGATTQHELATLAVLGGDRPKDTEGKTLLDLYGTPCDTCMTPEDECGWRDGEPCCEDCSHRPVETDRDEIIVPDAIKVVEADLFAGSRQQWLQTYAGYWFLPAGDRVIVIAPRPDEGYDVIWAWQDRRGGGFLVRAVPDLGYAMAQGESSITVEEEVLARKAGTWRKRRATEKQVNYCKALKCYELGMEAWKAGQVADKISIHKASARVDRMITRRLEA